MKNILYSFSFILFIVVFHMADKPRTNTATSIDRAKMNAISCSPAFDEEITKDANGKFIVPLPGWGNYGYQISTDNDSARFYFNQGLNMYYSYHQRESVASFKEAARFDSACAAIYWGEALAMGPGYNSAHLFKATSAIIPVLEQMNRFKATASAKENHLIEAMNFRYSNDGSDADRQGLNISYAAETKKLLQLYPEDNDIKMLYTDAIMLIHPWDFWNNDGTPKSWTPELVGLCETVLKKDPHHPAALHYYIHVTEASRTPEVALHAADLLGELLPGVPHMVHMSSHEYERNGFYAKGVVANDKADSALVNYDTLAKNLSLNIHSPHYFGVRAYCALSGGMYKEGLPEAMDCRNSVHPTHQKTYDQYLYMMPALTLVRLGKWQQILDDNNPPANDWSYAVILNNFARGLAFVYTGNTDSAARCLINLREKQKDPVLKQRRIPFNTPAEGAAIAENILSASISFSQKRNKEGIRGLKKAIEVEDKLIYTEPNDWPIPARQFLGAYLLKLGKPAEAEKTYKEDLIRNPGNGWSILGLYQSLKAQNKKKELSAYKKSYLNTFAAAEQLPPGSVYMAR